jgi:hypothetical protein
VKKITALVLIVLFFFNLFGYRLLVNFMQQKANVQLEASLDRNLYDDSKLIELKVPINLPYQTDWSAYQRCDGEIEISGVMYKYVKRKIANDTLYVMCIPNTKKMHLETAKNDFFKITNDLTQNNKSKKSDNSKSSFKNLQNEFDEYSFALNTNSSLDSPQYCWLTDVSKNLFSSTHVSPEQPPDMLNA